MPEAKSSSKPAVLDFQGYRDTLAQKVIEVPQFALLFTEKSPADALDWTIRLSSGTKTASPRFATNVSTLLRRALLTFFVVLGFYQNDYLGEVNLDLDA